MAHLIVPHRHGPFDDVEFRYCLRSIEANLNDPVPHTLTVVGDCPDWLDPDLHVPVDHPAPGGDGKVAEIRSFVRTACYELRGEDEVLYIDDDYFLLEPVESVLPLYWGPLRDHHDRIHRRHGPNFWLTVAHAATMNYLGEDRKPWSWELHRPLPIDPKEAVEVLPLGSEPLLWRTVYGNLASPVRTPYRAGGDGKVAGQRLPLGVTWLSSSDRSWRKSLSRPLTQMLRVPSRWERG